METIRIPKIGIIQLIKTGTYKYYEPNLYNDLTVHIVETCSSFEYETKLFISENDLALLLFDRVYYNDSFTIIVV